MENAVQLFWAGFQFNGTHGITEKVSKFAHDRSILPHAAHWFHRVNAQLIHWIVRQWHTFAGWFVESWQAFFEWFKQPRAS